MGAGQTALAQAIFISKRSTFFSYRGIFCSPKYMHLFRGYIFPHSFSWRCSFYILIYRYKVALYILTVVKGIILDSLVFISLRGDGIFAQFTATKSSTRQRSCLLIWIKSSSIRPCEMRIEYSSLQNLLRENRKPSKYLLFHICLTFLVLWFSQCLEIKRHRTCLVPSLCFTHQEIKLYLFLNEICIYQNTRLYCMMIIRKAENIQNIQNFLESL